MGMTCYCTTSHHMSPNEMMASKPLAFMTCVSLLVKQLSDTSKIFIHVNQKCASHYHRSNTAGQAATQRSTHHPHQIQLQMTKQQRSNDYNWHLWKPGRISSGYNVLTITDTNQSHTDILTPLLASSTCQSSETNCSFNGLFQKTSTPPL